MRLRFYRRLLGGSLILKRRDGRVVLRISRKPFGADGGRRVAVYW